MVEEKKVSFEVSREEIQWRWGGPVAQRIRARGYEPWCWEGGGSNPSSPTTFQRGKDIYFLPKGREIIIRIADVKPMRHSMLKLPWKSRLTK
jgi:hypothetical protein